MNNETQYHKNILLVEDNPGDVLLIKEAFSETELRCKISVASNGDQAMQMLRKKINHKREQKPDLILLDLNMPGKTGREVLSEIKSDHELKSIPVVIMSGSKAPIDITDTYKLHANSYIVKPAKLNQLVDIIKTIQNFWFNVTVFPMPTADSNPLPQ